MAQIDLVTDTLVGEWLSLPDVAGRLDIPISRVKQLLRDRKLVAVNRPGGERCVPAAFLDGPQVVKGLNGTLTVLFDCGFDDEEALRWLFTADETLPGTPIEALYKHRGTEVNRRAQALAFLQTAISAARRAMRGGHVLCERAVQPGSLICRAGFKDRAGWPLPP